MNMQWTEQQCFIVPISQFANYGKVPSLCPLVTICYLLFLYRDLRNGYEKTEQTGNVHTEDDIGPKEEGNKSLENCRKTSSRDKTVCCDVQLYPVNNMVSGYAHIDQLKKYSGELHDFLPSHSGFSISSTHSRRHPYQHKLGQT
ncbi:telomere repeats-binding bouquet formation protein 2-like isoform X1 [Hoplias malabaricus]|uniref:telomere repeats-binding bouquet formation protein 2-like isoform X1 n=1 Tax=Hoplias malabaricus TaxID=27720 RepID=UPI0034624199